MKKIYQKKTPEQELEEQYKLLELLRKEEDAEHFVEKPAKHSSFMLDKDLSKALDKEQANLFGTVLVQNFLDERNAGALK